MQLPLWRLGFIEVIDMLHFATLLLTALFLQDPSLDSASPRERLDAIEQLTRPGARENVPALADALMKESRKEVRAAIVSGLARIRTPEIVPVLANTLRTDLDKDVRLQTIDSFQRLYIQIEDTGPIRTIFNRVRSAFVEPDRPVVGDEVVVDSGTKEALAGAMQTDFNQEVRAAAARALGSLKAKDQVPVMVRTLENPQNREHKEVRLQIIESLGLMRDPAAGPALETALRDRDDEIVAAAVFAIGTSGYSPARAQVENVFRTGRSRNVRRRAIESLSLMRDAGNIPLFESLLSDSDNYNREMAAAGLARLDYDHARLQPNFDAEREATVRNALAFALAAGNQDQYINNLANALDSRQDFQVEVYLFELGRYEGKLSELHRYLQSPNPKVRAGMARVLGNVGNPASRVPLEALREDPDINVLRESTAALRRLSAQ